MNINVNPIITNKNSVSSEAIALASALNRITVSDVIKVIDESDLGVIEKEYAKDVINELEKASGAKDTGRFLGAVEKITGIAKNVAELGNSLIPLIVKFASGFIQ